VDTLGESTPSIQPLVVRPEGVDTVWNSIAEPTPSIQDAYGFRPEGVDAVGASTPLSLAAVARRDEHGSSGVPIERTRVGWLSHPATELVLPDGTAATRATPEGDPGDGRVLGVPFHGVNPAFGCRPAEVDAVGAPTPLPLAAFARRDEHGSPGVPQERTRVGGFSHPFTELGLPDGTAATEVVPEEDPGGGPVLCVLSHHLNPYFLTRPLPASEREPLGVTPARGWRACVFGSFTRQ